METSLYQDTMDRSRVIKQVKLVGNHYECAVYWRARNGKLNYGGRTSISARMFDPGSPLTQRAGFVPVSGDTK